LPNCLPDLDLKLLDLQAGGVILAGMAQDQGICYTLAGIIPEQDTKIWLPRFAP
jgi:hypothetical protein